MVRVRLDAALRAFGITSTQYMLLSLVSREGGLSSAELARRMSVTPQSMNESVTALEAKALIRRTEHRGNRRILHLALTPQGRRLLAACERSVDQVERELFGSLRVRSLDEFRAVMEEVVDVMAERSAG